MLRVTVTGAAGAAVAACVAGTPHVSSAVPGKAWLTSSWVDQKETCATARNVLRYLPDGTYTFYDEVGRWELVGSTLSLTQAAIVNDAGVRMEQPRATVHLKAERLPDDGLRVIWPRGDVYTFHRCG